MPGFMWEQSQQNRITFVMVDASGNEVSGLGAGFTLEIAKNGGAFAASGGTKAEMSDGWYTYLSTAAEADTVGPVSIRVTGTGAIQQNLEYVVKARNVAGVDYTYTVTEAGSGNPIEGANVSIATDNAGANVVWRGVTDTFGVARDATNNEKPFLDPGTYFIWVQKAGYTFPNPDTEVVS